MAAVLIIEDNAANREALVGFVSIMGYQIVAAESAEEAIRILDERGDVLLVLCDIRLPGMDGIAFKEAARKRRPDLKVAFMTGDSQAAEEAIASGAIAMLKPYDFKILTHVIVDALAKP